MWGGGGATTAHTVQAIQAAGAGTTHLPGVVLRAARLRRLVTQQGGGEGAHRTPHLPAPWATARGRYATMQLANYLHHEMYPQGSAAATLSKIVIGIASASPQGAVGASPPPPILPARAAGATWWRMVSGRDIGARREGEGGENPPGHVGHSLPTCCAASWTAHPVPHFDSRPVLGLEPAEQPREAGAPASTHAPAPARPRLDRSYVYPRPPPVCSAPPNARR